MQIHSLYLACVLIILSMPRLWRGFIILSIDHNLFLNIELNEASVFVKFNNASYRNMLLEFI